MLLKYIDQIPKRPYESKEDIDKLVPEMLYSTTGNRKIGDEYVTFIEGIKGPLSAARFAISELSEFDL